MKWFYPLEGQFPKENEEVIIDTSLGEIKVIFKDKTRWENNAIGYTNPKRWRRVEKAEQKAEQKAEEYYYKNYPVTLDIGEEERKKVVTDIFIAGYLKCENEHKDDWHTPEEEPVPFGKYANERYPQIPCLVDIKNYGYGIRYWNVKEKCWDDESCDDYYCDMDRIKKWAYIKEDE